MVHPHREKKGHKGGCHGYTQKLEMTTATVTSEQPDRLEFTLTDVDIAVANALRRSLLADVPNVAALREDVKVTVNTGVLHDDFIASRVALVPVKLRAAEIDAYVPGSVTLHLDVSNGGMTPHDVTTRDLEVRLHGVVHPLQRSVMPACPRTGDFILLTRLRPGQRLALTATLRKGTPSTHAAYASASLVAFGPREDPAAVAAARGQLPAGDPVALNQFETIGRRRLVLKNDAGEPSSFDFTVESESGMTARELVDRAFSAIAARFVKPNVTAVQLRADPKHLQFSVQGEGHTFGSVLQSVVVDNADAMGVASAGYFEPHPLDPRIVIKVRTADAAPVRTDPDALFREMCDLAADRVAEAKQAFAALA